MELQEKSAQENQHFSKYFLSSYHFTVDHTQ